MEGSETGGAWVGTGLGTQATSHSKYVHCTELVQEAPHEDPPHLGGNPVFDR